LLWLEGHSTMGLPYEERRRLLEDLNLNGPNWQTPPSHRGDGSTLLEATRAGGLEGVVAKRLDSTYEPGVRTRHWLKVKNHCSQELVIGGWLPGEGSRARLGALVVGTYDGARLVYAGRVGTGFTDAELTRLTRLLEERARPDSPFDPPPPIKGVRFVQPELVAEVTFTEWTAAGILRHPAYKGLRDDRDPGDVVREPTA
ncbi:MAG: non-homologous end-joining DNA ligase, partial [Acidimicrobiia bacterium]